MGILPMIKIYYIQSERTDYKAVPTVRLVVNYLSLGQDAQATIPTELHAPLLSTFQLSPLYQGGRHLWGTKADESPGFASLPLFRGCRDVLGLTPAVRLGYDRAVAGAGWKEPSIKPP